MKTRFLIISIIVLFVICVLVSLTFILGISQFGSEHCPGLELRKSLGLVDPNARCL